MNKLIKEAKRMQKLAGIIKENINFNELNSENQSFNNFVKLVAKDIFTAGVDDPTMAQVNDWDTLFQYWDDFGNLSLHTQSDIIQLAKDANLSSDDINYILDLPQVSNLEQG